MSCPPPPEWLWALVHHLEEAPPEPGLHHVEIRHDHDCPRLLETGACACEPEVVTGPAIDHKYGGEE